MGLGRVAVACTGLVALLACLQAPASAQVPCAKEDLACRVDRLEAKLAQMEGKQAILETKQAALPPPAPVQTVTTWTACRRGSCAAEATALCTSKGFASGAVKVAQKLPTGSYVLQSALCTQ